MNKQTIKKQPKFSVVELAIQPGNSIQSRTLAFAVSKTRAEKLRDKLEEKRNSLGTFDPNSFVSYLVKPSCLN